MAINIKTNPQATFFCQNWRIMQYSEGIVLQNSEAHTYEIVSSTETISRIPYYVQQYMRKHHLLDTWELTQLAKITENIRLIREQHERFMYEQYREANPLLSTVSLLEYCRPRDVQLLPYYPLSLFVNSGN